MTYLFIESVIKSCDSPDWLVHTCYQSASSRVTENKSLAQKCFSVENLIIVSLNTVIPIIVMFSYQRLLDVSINGLFIAIQCLFLFKRSVSGNAHRVLTQIGLFSRDVL